jgi:hypothetical protein
MPSIRPPIGGVIKREGFRKDGLFAGKFREGDTRQARPAGVVGGLGRPGT